MAVTASLSGTVVTFDGSASTGSLHLRSNAGVLEWSESGGSGWSNDLDTSAAGTNTLSLAGGLTVNSKIEGALNLGTIQTAGGALSITAASALSVGGGSVVSTRRIAAGASDLTANSIGNSGALTLKAQQLTLAANSAVLANANAGFTPAKVSLLASQAVNTYTPVVHIKTATAGINVAGATIKGGDVRLYSAAVSDEKFDDTSEATDWNAMPTWAEGISAYGGVSVATSTSTITVAGGSRIEGANVEINAIAQTAARVLTTANDKALAFAYGESKPTATVDVKSGASINATGAVAITSSADSTVSISAKRSLTGPSKTGSDASFTIAISEAAIVSKADVASGATINAGGDVDVLAKMVKHHSTSASAGAYEDGSVGAAIALSNATSDTSASLGGTVDARGGVHVDSESKTLKNDTQTASGVGTGVGAGFAIKVKEGMSSAAGKVVSKLQPAPKASSGSTTKLALSAAFTYAQDTNHSTAQIADGAKVTADGDLRVKSLLVYVPETSATATVDSAKLDKENPSGNTKDNSISAAINVGSFTNTSDARIGKNATVDAKRSLQVDARTVQPYDIQWLNLNGVGDVTDKLNSNLGIQNGFVTSWAQSNAAGEKTGIAGSINITSFDNDTNAYIDAGAKVNQNKTARTDQQHVSVTALNDVESVNLAGVFGLKVLNAGGSVAGAGGAYLDLTQNNRAKAVIRSGASVYGGSLLVRANSIARSINIAESGGKGGDYAVYGSVSLVALDNSSISQIDDGATVTTGNLKIVLPKDFQDLFGESELTGLGEKIFGASDYMSKPYERVPLAFDTNQDGKVDASDDGISSVDANNYNLNLNTLVSAEDSSQVFNIAGGIAKGKNVGIGVGIALTDVTRDTHALIGNRKDEADDTSGSLTAGGKLAVQAANHGTFDTHALAAAIATPDSETQKDEKQKNAKDAKKGGGKFGLGVSGDAAVNEVDDHARAAINDSTVTATGPARVTAENESVYRTVGGAVAIAGGSNSSTGLAGSYVSNILTNETSATVDNATLTAAGLTLDARQSGDVLSVTASGSGSSGMLALAGSVSVNTIDNDTTASIRGGSTITTTGGGAVALSASDRSKILAVAGALAGGGKAGVGASFAWNEVDADTEASIRASDVASAGAMSLAPTNDADIQTVSAAIAVGLSGMAPAAAITVSEITQNTTAVIDGRRTAAGVDVAGDLTINATNTSDIKSIAGNISAAPGSGAGVGGSGAWNEIDGATTAGLQNGADVDVKTAAVGPATGAVTITTKNESTIQTLSAGVAASGANAIGGSVSLNMLRTTAEARIAGNSKLVADNGASVVATNTSTIKSLAGQAAFGSGGVAVGVAAAYNDIADKTYAKVDGGSVTTNAKSVVVSASSTPTINTIAAGGSASGGVVSVAGSVAVNLIANDTRATLNNTTVTAKDNVNVLANTGGTITFYGGVLSASLGGGVGATAAVNSIANTTKALVTNSTVNAKGTNPISIPRADGSGATDSVRGVNVVATDSIDVDVIVANVSGGIKAGIAGTVAVTTRDDTTQAQVSGSTINANQSGADAAAGVRVRALSTADIDSKAGGVALGGVAGVGATAGTVIDTSNTSATIAGGSAVHANGSVEAISNSRTRVNNVAISGGLSLGTGVAGSVSVVKIDQTNEAAVDGSTVRAGGNLTVNADDDVILGKQADGTKTGVLAGAAGIGVGGAGIGGTILVNQVDNSTVARITDSSTDARGTTTVKADQFTDVTSYGVTAAGGSYVGVAGTVSVNSIKNTTLAKIEEVSGTTAVNQQAAFKNASQHVNVQAVDTATLEAKNGSLSVGGIVGAGASVDVSTIKNITTAAIGANTDVAAGGNVSVDADGSKTVDVTVVAAGGGLIGVQGSVAVLGIGGAITAEALGQVNGKSNPGGTATEVTRQADGGLDAGILGGESTGTTALSNANATTAGVSVSSDFSTSSPTAYGVTASIGVNAQLNAGGKLSVTADDVVKVKQTAGAVAGGLLGIGGGVAIATVKPSAAASVAGGAAIDAGGAVEVIATGKVNDSDVTAAAGAAGVVGLGAAVAKLNSTNNATATFGGTLNSAASLKVDSSITSDLDAEAKGATAGAAAVGVVIANASENGSALSSLAGSAKVGQTSGKTVGSLQVTAGSDTKVVGNSTAASGGILSGSGSVASAFNTPTVRAFADAGSKATVTGNALLRGVALGGVSTTADGVNIGGITVGVSTATGNWSPTVEAGLRGSATAGGGAWLTAGSADIRAYQNYKVDGTLDTTRTLRATAKTANGSLIGGTGSTASVSSDADARATLGQNTTTSVTGTLNVATKSAHNALAAADGKSYGLAAASITSSLATVDNDSIASTGTGAKVTAGAANFTADSNVVANSTATGGYGGLIGVGGTESKTDVRSDNTKASLGSLTILTATGEVLLQAFNTLDLDTYSQIDSAGGITANEVKGTVNVNSSTTAEIGSGAAVTADKVSVVAKDLKSDLLAKSYSKTYAAASNNTASSYVTANVIANANIGANAAVYALQQLNLVSRQEAVSSVANAKTEIGGGVTGKLTSRASNNLTANSKVNTGVGSTLTTRDLEVDADTPQVSGGYEQIADTEAQTVTKWVSKVVGEVCSVVVEIFTFGLVSGSQVCKPLVKLVQEVTYSAENQIREGSETRGTQIDFNSDVIILGASNPTLVVDSTGKVTRAENVSYTDDGATITVANIANTSTGKVRFNAPKATMSGTASFTFLNTFDVLIQNASGKNVVVNDVSVYNKGKTTPDLVLPLDESTTGSSGHTHAGANANFTYTVKNSFATAKVDVVNTGNSDVTLKGLIDNPGGTTTISNTGVGGDIFASGTAQDIETRVLSVSAAKGTVGTSTNKVNARIVQAADLTPSLTFSGDAGVFAVLAGILRGAGTLSFSEASITSNGAVGLSLKDGTRQTLVGGAVVTTTQASTYAFATLTAKGDITIDAGSVATVNLVATVAQADNGKLVVTATGNVTLTETLGAMRVGSVASTGGDVALTSSSGSILDADSDAAADVTGNSITLAAPTTGSIGTADDLLEINSSNAAAGTVTATSGNGVFLSETTGDLNVKLVSTPGDVTLGAQAGSIVDLAAPSTPDIVGRNLILDATGSLGTASNPLDAKVARLEASAGSGGIALLNAGGLGIGGISSKVGVTSAGPATITAAGPITIEENVTAGGPVVLTATDSATAGQDMLIKSGVSVKSTGRSVTLRSGDNLTLEAGAAIAALTTATIQADYNDADAGTGVNVSLLGTITADTASVQTGNDADTVTIAGITAGTETRVETFAGSDTINLRAAAADTSIDAGADNDTINLGSLAPAVGGTMNGITTPVTVDGNTGVDVLNLDDRAETAATTATITKTTIAGLSAGTVTYAALETLNVDTGVADDVINVRGTSAVTNVNANNGNDRFYVADTANATAGGPYPAYLLGNVDSIGATLNLDGGAGTQSLMVSDSTATAGDANVTLTKSSITGLAPAAINYAASGNFLGGVTVWTGQGADNVNVASTLNTGGGRTVTTLNLGGGDDKATVTLGTADGFFVANGQAGNDNINGSASTRSLILFGGAGNDTLTGGSAADVILGDTGRVEYRDASGNLGTMIGSGGDAALVTGIADDRTDGVERLATAIYTLDPTRTGNDVISAGAGNDIALGGNGRDSISGGAGNDVLLGDNGRLAGSIDASKLPVSTTSMPFTITSTDTAAAQGDADTLAGDDGADIITGGQGGDSISGGTGDDDLVGGHNVAGGSDGNDTIDGGLGNDAIAGDNASIVRTGSALSSRIRRLTGTAIYDAVGNLLVSTAAQLDPRGMLERLVTLLDHSTTAAAGTSGDDVIAGGGGDDKIFGQLGNDTIQGDGAANVIPANAATDGDDYVEGGGGNDTIYGNGGQDDLIGGSSSLYGLTTAAQRPDGSDTIYGGSGAKAGRYDDGDAGQNAHSADADVILGDNGNVFRLIGANGQYLRFAYDLYGSLGITPRGVQTLDYTLGGSLGDVGAGDLLIGEAGDDSVYGQAGNDVIFGNGQDDDLIGGSGHDRIYGGNGEDGILGDDGVIRTSRNGLAEPLSGLTKANGEASFSLPGNTTGFWSFIQGRLQKDVTLQATGKGGNDVIFGGLGDDFLHGGAGDDAISGAEAQAAYYNALPVSNLNPLGYNPSTRKLAAYNANDPLRKIADFILNFDAIDAAGAKINDGKDRIFGDWGNDWLVGGTNNDRLFGGQGDDVMNADDNLDTNGGLNNTPDATLFADADFVYGGDGLDVMIANTGADRLFDWSGEFNTYLVPFAAFGEPTVSRSPSPHVQQFLLDLARESGADQSNTGPTGEIGLFTQKDPQWGQNHGSPRDPQPGNIGGTQRDTKGAPEDDRSKRQSINAQYAIVR